MADLYCRLHQLNLQTFWHVSQELRNVAFCITYHQGPSSASFFLLCLPHTAKLKLETACCPQDPPVQRSKSELLVEWRFGYHGGSLGFTEI